MSAVLLIVFREVLEAAMVIGIVLAVTRGDPHRGRWAGAGLAAGIAGAAFAALFAEAITSALHGIGQELFNASILLLAVGMLGWHNAWMARTGRAMSRELNALGQSIRTSERPAHVIAVVIGLATLREGSETILFLYGIVASEHQNSMALIMGGLIGLALGGAVGAAMYFGLVRFSGKYLFALTSGLIILLAAGMAAQAVNFLVQAGLLPPLGPRVWDTSRIIADGEPLGSFLHILIGYTARPAGIQIVFYVATVIAIGGLMYMLRNDRRIPPVSAIALPLLLSGFLAFFPGREAIAADLKVYSPIVEEGEFGIEARGNVAIDGDSTKSGEQTHKYEIEFTPTSY